MDTKSRRRFPSIRLSTVMLLVVICALTVGYVVQTRQLARLSEQLAVVHQREAMVRYEAEVTLARLLTQAAEQQAVAQQADAAAEVGSK